MRRERDPHLQPLLSRADPAADFRARHYDRNGSDAARAASKRTPVRRAQESGSRFEQLESRLAMAVVINEFLADNESGITDFAASGRTGSS